MLPFLPSWGAPFPPLTPPASTATLEGTVPPPRWTQIPASCSVAGVRAGSPGVWAGVPPRVFPRRRNGLATHVSRRVPAVKRCTATINANRTATSARQSKGLIHHRGSVLTFQESDKRLGNLGNLENRLTWEHTGGGSPRGAPPPPPPEAAPLRGEALSGQGARGAWLPVPEPCCRHGEAPQSQSEPGCIPHASSEPPSSRSPSRSSRWGCEGIFPQGRSDSNLRFLQAMMVTVMTKMPGTRRRTHQYTFGFPGRRQTEKVWPG